MTMFGRDSQRKTKKKLSAYQKHARVVSAFMKSRGRSGFVGGKVYSALWDSAKQRPVTGWREKALKMSPKGGAKRGKGGKRKGGRRGGTNLDSFSGLDSFLNRLLGGVKRVLSPRLRPSESLAQRKVKLQELIGKMERGVAALKERERVQDLQGAAYKKHVQEIRNFQKAISDLKKAWRDAHRKQGGRTTGNPFPSGWNEHEPYGGGPGDFGGFGAGVRDPQRRKKKSKKKGSKSGSKGKKRTTASKAKQRAKMKAYWRAVKSGRTRRKGYSPTRAKAKKKSPKRRPKKRSSKKRSSKKRSSRRDWSGDFGSFE